MNTFELTAWDDGGVRVVCVAGEFDIAGCPLFRERSAPNGAELLVVDLRRVTFLDSRAIAELIVLQRDTGRSGTQYAILRPRGTADKIFKLTGIDVHLPLYDERIPVLAEFNYG